MASEPLAATERTDRSRMSSEEVRERMLAVALDYVHQTGLSVGFEKLSLDELIRKAGVPRSSTYRMWESRERFIADLLVEVAERSARSLLDTGTLETCVGLLSSNVHRLDDAEERRRLMIEVVRVALEHNYYAVIDSVDWQSFLAMSATLLSNTRLVTSRKIEEALRRGNEQFIESMAVFHREFAEVLGFRLRPEYGDDYRIYAVLCSAVVEGIGVRHLSNPAITDNYYPGPPSLSGEKAEWSLAALGMLALFEHYMQPVPDYDADHVRARLRAGAWNSIPAIEA